jgi:hypothetical protein
LDSTGQRVSLQLRTTLYLSAGLWSAPLPRL